MRTRSTPRIALEVEHRIICLLANGFPPKYIAGQIGIAEKTLGWHIPKIRARLNCPSLADLVHFAIYHRLIPLKKDDHTFDPSRIPQGHHARRCGFIKCGASFLTKENQHYCCPEHAVMAKRLNDKMSRGTEFFMRICAYRNCRVEFRADRKDKIFHTRKCKLKETAMRWKDRHPGRQQQYSRDSYARKKLHEAQKTGA